MIDQNLSTISGTLVEVLCQHMNRIHQCMSLYSISRIQY